MNQTYEIGTCSEGTYFSISNKSKNILILNNIQKQLNTHLYYNYASNLIKLLDIKKLNYLEREGAKECEYLLHYNTSELEIISKICELFDIVEFEKFNHEFSILIFNKIAISYNIINSTFKIITDIPNAPRTYFNLQFTNYNNHSRNLRLKICNTNYIKLKLLLYIANKQNSLNNLIDQLEKIAILGGKI